MMNCNRFFAGGSFFETNNIRLYEHIIPYIVFEDHSLSPIPGFV
jgi:hypothetical protein